MCLLEVPFGKLFPNIWREKHPLFLPKLLPINFSLERWFLQEQRSLSASNSDFAVSLFFSMFANWNSSERKTRLLYLCMYSVTYVTRDSWLLLPSVLFILFPKLFQLESLAVGGGQVGASNFSVQTHPSLSFRALSYLLALGNAADACDVFP